MPPLTQDTTTYVRGGNLSYFVGDNERVVSYSAILSNAQSVITNSPDSL